MLLFGALVFSFLALFPNIPVCLGSCAYSTYISGICENMTKSQMPLENFRTSTRIIHFKNSSFPILWTNAFSKVPNLQYVYVNSSKIETIETGAFGNLVNSVMEIYLQDNSIRNISRGCFNSLAKLKVLDLSNNRIDHIEADSFHGSTLLETILLKNNSIAKIPPSLFNSLAMMKLCDISYNRLESIDFHLPTNPDNHVLILKQNRIKIIDCEVFHEGNLQVLDLSNNQLTFLNGSCFPKQLQQVAFTKNAIVNISNLAYFDDKLTNLDLGYNQIESLSSDSLQNNTNLLSLRLDNNKITALPIGIFNNLYRLQNLDVSNNLLGYLNFGVFHNLSKLVTLDLSHNRMEIVEETVFHPLIALKTLNLSYNNLSYVNLMQLNYCPKLELINVLGNRIPCQKLAAMVNYKLKLSIVNGTFHNVTNVRGIPCLDSNLVFYNVSKNESESKKCTDYSGIAQKIDKNSTLLLSFSLVNVSLFALSILIVIFTVRRKSSQNHRTSFSFKEAEVQLL